VKVGWVTWNNVGMNPHALLDQEWQTLLQLLPADRDAAAHRLGALTRKRQIRDADALLRLLFVYAWGGLSLRNTAAWAKHQQVATLSDVALLERFQKAEAWVGWLLAQMVRAQCARPDLPSVPYRLRVVDATVICQPGSKGSDWRVHLDLDLSQMRSDHLQLTDAHGGESFTCFAVQAGDLLLGDRGYAHRRGIAHVVGHGGQVLVRFSWQNLPLQHPDGTAFDLMSALVALPAGQGGEWAVQTAPAPKAGLPAVGGRVIAVRKDASAAEAAKRQARKQARKKGHTVDARTLLSCEFVLLFTSVPAAVVEASTLLALYRWRWQVECGFKRLKSIVALDALPAHDPRLCRAWLYAKLLGALLVETYAASWVAFSPWGSRPAPQCLSVASVADAVARLATGGGDRIVPGPLAGGSPAPTTLVLRSAA
jgi:DDE family transposase